MFDPFHFGNASLRAVGSRWLVTIAVASLLSAAAGGSVIYLFLAGVGTQIPHAAVSRLPVQARPFSIDNIPEIPFEPDVNTLAPEAPEPVSSLMLPVLAVSGSGITPAGPVAPIDALPLPGAASGETASDSAAVSPSTGESNYGAASESFDSSSLKNQMENGSESDKHSRSQQAQSLSQAKKTGAAVQPGFAGKSDHGLQHKSKCLPGQNVGRVHGGS